MLLRPSDMLSVRLTLPLREAELLVRSALQAEQFGIITEIDFQQKFREKLGVDSAPIKLLGACNPQLASVAIGLNPDVALALPCNVVLREVGGTTVVSALRPTVALERYGALILPLAEQAEAALSRVFADLPQ